MGYSSGQRSLWDRVANNLQEWYTEAVGWTGEKARIGVKRMDMLGIQHNIKRSMTHLGGRVYDLIQKGEDIRSDTQVGSIVDTLRKLEEELAGREREIEALRARRAGDDADDERAQASRASGAGSGSEGGPEEDA